MNYYHTQIVNTAHKTKKFFSCLHFINEDHNNPSGCLINSIYFLINYECILLRNYKDITTYCFFFSTHPSSFNKIGERKLL